MKQNKSIWYLAAVLSSTALLQSTPAIAGKQIYPGSMCVSWDGNLPVPSLSSSRIFNNSTIQEMLVDCPILHQQFSRRRNDLDDAHIGVINNHTSQSARCWLVSKHQEGTILRGGGGGTRVALGASAWEQNLDFDTTSDRHPDNWYYIGCSIPRKQAGRGSSGITYYSGQD